MTVLRRIGKRGAILGIVVTTITGGAAAIGMTTASSSPAILSLAAASGATAPEADRPAAAAPKALKAIRKVVARRLIKETAALTGQTVKQITTRLRAGETLDAIAGAKASDVKGAVLAQLTSRLDKAVSNGKLTPAQETKLLTAAGRLIDRLMSAVHKPKASGALRPAHPAAPPASAATGTSDIATT